MTFSRKALLLTISIAIIVITLATIVNAATTYKTDLKNYMTKAHTICGKTYQLNSNEKTTLSNYLSIDSVTENQAKEALEKLQTAENLLNAKEASNLSAVSSADKKSAASLIEQAGKAVGLEVKINTETNRITITEISTKKSIASASYSTDDTGNLVFSNITSSYTIQGNNSGSGGTTQNTYAVLEGKNQVYSITSGKPLVFRFDADYSLFQNGGKVYIDGTVLESSKYTSKSGSTIISVNNDYAKTLKPGNHTLKLALNNGKEASAPFSVSDGKTATTNTAANTNTTNTTNTTAAPAATNSQATNSGQAFAYTGNNNIGHIVLSLLAVVAVSTAFIKKVYDK